MSGMARLRFFYGSVLLNFYEYVRNAEFGNLSYGSDGQIKATRVDSLQRNCAVQELKLM
jgi:hypothetical protein